MPFTFVCQACGLMRVCEGFCQASPFACRPRATHTHTHAHQPSRFGKRHNQTLAAFSPLSPPGKNAPNYMYTRIPLAHGSNIQCEISMRQTQMRMRNERRRHRLCSVFRFPEPNTSRPTSNVSRIICGLAAMFFGCVHDCARKLEDSFGNLSGWSGTAIVWL